MTRYQVSIWLGGFAVIIGAANFIPIWATIAAIMALTLFVYIHLAEENYP